MQQPVPYLPFAIRQRQLPKIARQVKNTLFEVCNCTQTPLTPYKGGLPMTHHEHHHSHSHGHAGSAQMENKEKLKKLLEHWLSHNVDHAENYRKWAAIAREEGMEEAAAILEEAAQLTLSLNDKFSTAAKSI